MIDEHVLTDWLREEAEQVPVPPDATATIADLLADHQLEHRRNRRQLVYLAAIAAAVVAIAFALGPGRDSISGETKNAPAAVRIVLPSTTMAQQASATTTVATDQLRRGAQSVTLSGRTLSPAADAPDVASGVTGAGGTPTDSARVIRTGSIDLEVADDQLGKTVGRITAIAEGAGGYVAKQETTEHGDTPNAVVTIRVPGEEFTATVERVRGLGTVLSASSKGADVTAQYTDLQARRRSLDAARNSLLTVLQGTRTTGEILAVLDRVTEVQTRLEEIDGQLQLLDDQTSFGSLTVSINEPVPEARPTPAADDKSGLEQAFEDAKSGFSRRVEWLVAHSGSGIVIAAGLLAALLALRLSWVRLRRGWL